jgi:hypothetical protein
MFNMGQRHSLIFLIIPPPVEFAVSFLPDWSQSVFPLAGVGDPLPAGAVVLGLGFG